MYAIRSYYALTEVTQARASVGQMKLPSSALNDTAAIAAYQKAQGDLSSALSRLLVVAELV